MRFPLTAEFDPTSIDEKQATRMLYYAIDNGVNYLDTAYPYHRQTSEKFLGKVIQGKYREKVYLATKMPIWLIKEKGDVKKYFNEQLARLKTDTIDMYHLHSLGGKSWQTVQEHNVLSYLDKLKKDGKIRFAGFSFHDKLPLFKKIVDAYPWTFCLVHVNYVDHDYQAGVEGIKYAHEKGIAVIIMEPLRGGKLAHRVPDDVLALIRQTGREQTPAEFAFRWLFNKPEVSCILSGMSSMEEVKQNLIFASEEHINSITNEENKIYDKARDIYRSRTVVNCTQCDYCAPCDQKIPISFILTLYNDAHMYDSFDRSRWAYRVFIKPENRADKCTACAQCEERCPQNIPVAEFLEKAHRVLKPEK